MKNTNDVEHVRSEFFGKAGKYSDKDFDPNERIADNQTALHWFAYYGDDTMITILCHSGADPNIVDDSGMTPAHFAAWQGCGVALHELLRFGAEPTILTKSGKSIADMARLGGHFGIAEMMDKHIARKNSAGNLPRLN